MWARSEASLPPELKVWMRGLSPQSCIPCFKDTRFRFFLVTRLDMLNLLHRFLPHSHSRSTGFSTHHTLAFSEVFEQPNRWRGISLQADCQIQAVCAVAGCWSC